MKFGSSPDFASSISCLAAFSIASAFCSSSIADFALLTMA
jgi:hypothetical protein